MDNPNRLDIQHRNDGIGPVGINRKALLDTRGVLSTEDQRGGTLIWLADHGALEIAEAAAEIAKMIEAAARIGAEELDLLSEAVDAITAPTEPSALQGIAAVVMPDGASSRQAATIITGAGSVPTAVGRFIISRENASPTSGCQ